MSRTLARRAWLRKSALFSMMSFLEPGTSWAKSRPIHGGRLVSSLPLDLSEIDPHDPESLTASLLGLSLFEALYARTTGGSVYPTLAAQLPFLRNSRAIVTLRRKMRFSDGSPIDASAVRQSLIRSRRHALDGHVFPIPSINSDGELAFDGVEASTLAERLCQLSHAVLPPRFVPTSIVTSGAFRSDAQDEKSLVLSHNPLCPRGGSFLDELSLRSQPVATTLRDFESRASDLALLGRGLHAPRPDSRPFELQDIALVVVLASETLRAELRPGALQDLADGLPRGPLEALCVYGERSVRRHWFAAPTDLWVVESDPWMVALAETMARSWSARGAEVRVRPTSRREWRRRRTTSSFGLALTVLRTEAGTEAVTRRLFFLDEKLPPRSFAQSPAQAARQLHSAVVGLVRPRGGLARAWTAATVDGQLALNTARRSSHSS